MKMQNYAERKTFDKLKKMNSFSSWTTQYEYKKSSTNHHSSTKTTLPRLPLRISWISFSSWTTENEYKKSSTNHHSSTKTTLPEYGLKNWHSSTDHWYSCTDYKAWISFSSWTTQYEYKKPSTNHHSSTKTTLPRSPG